MGSRSSRNMSGWFWSSIVMNATGHVLQLCPVLSDTFTDQTLRFIDAADSARPWFGYLAFTAPHWPIQAHEADVAKVAGRVPGGVAI